MNMIIIWHVAVWALDTRHSNAYVREYADDSGAQSVISKPYPLQSPTKKTSIMIRIPKMCMFLVTIMHEN